MAVDEAADEPKQQKQEEPSSKDVQQDPPSQGVEVDTTSYPTSFGASIGDRSKDPDMMDFDQPKATTLDEQLPERVDMVEIPDTLTGSQLQLLKMPGKYGNSTIERFMIYHFHYANNSG